MEIQREKASVAWLSVISNTCLVIAKMIIGFLIGSVSVISEAIHSGVDLLAAIIALIAVKTSGKPADADHPYGHGKYENLSGTIEALLIFFAAGMIIHEAWKKMMHPESMGNVGWGVVVMLVSALVNIIVSNRLFKVGVATDSVALQADAWHLRTDVYTSAGVMAGLAIIWVGDRFWHVDLHWVDPIAALLVALLIIKAAVELTIQAARDLMDVSLPPEEEASLREFIKGFYPTVRNFHHLRTRKSGPNRFVDAHILVDSSMTVERSHVIADKISLEIKTRFPGTTVTIHIEPCDASCKPVCVSGCLLRDDERKALQK